MMKGSTSQIKNGEETHIYIYINGKLMLQLNEKQS